MGAFVVVDFGVEPAVELFAFFVLEDSESLLLAFFYTIVS